MPQGNVAVGTEPRTDSSRRLQALADIGNLVTLGLDAHAIVEHTTQAIARLTRSPRARMWLVDEETDDLVLDATAGEASAPEDIGQRRPAVLNTLNHRILAKGEVYQTTDASAEPGWTGPRLGREHDLHTFVGVPLAVGTRKYGILSLRFPDARVLADEDLDVLKTMASQASAALHNARAYEESRRNEERLTTLAEISRLVTSSLELESVLDAATHAAARLLDVEMVGAWICDETERVLHLGALVPPIDLFRLRTIPLDGSVAGWVLQSRAPFATPRIREHPLSLHALAPEIEVNGALFVPLFQQERPLGVLVALTRKERNFGARDVRLLQVLGDQVAVAIENARLYEGARQQAQQLAMLMGLNKHLALGPRLEQILENITEGAAKILGAEGAGLRLVDGDIVIKGAVHGIASELMFRERHPVNQGLNGLVIQTQRALFITHPQTDERIDPALRERLARVGVRSWLGVPLRGRERVVGALYVVSRRARGFTAAEIEILEAFADQAAIAIENARLFAQVQSRQRQLEAIRELTSDLTRELDINRLLELTLAGATKLLGASSGSVFLWNEEKQELSRLASCGRSAVLVLRTLKLGEGITGLAAERREAVIENDYRSSQFALPELIDGNPVTAAMAEPMLYQGGLVGVITVNSDDPARSYSADESQLLGIFAGQAAIAIDNARLFKKAARVEALDELARLKTEFLSTVSHELRTPLSLIHGYSELLVARANRLSGEQVSDMAREIHVGSQTMANLVDDLLDFSRIEQERLELRRKDVCVSDLLERLADAHRHEPHGERLVTEIQPGMRGCVDPERLSQAVNHLITNAFRYAPTGAVTVRARAEGAILRVEVTDQGPGLSTEEQERLWEKFFRGAAGMNSAIRGSGVGLTVTRHLIQLHGGEVGVRSKPGDGATFWFTIPLQVE